MKKSHLLKKTTSAYEFNLRQNTSVLTTMAQESEKREENHQNQ